MLHPKSLLKLIIYFSAVAMAIFLNTSISTADTVINDITIIPSYGLPKTGQTTSYDTGDDGDLEVGIARGYTYTDPITSEATNTLTDNATGLMWIRDHTLVNGTGGATGGNVDISGTMNWATALSRCNSLSYAGYDDWRAPNLYELYSICHLENAVGAPYIDTTAFPNTYSAGYWSSTTSPGSTGSALRVLFGSGLLLESAKSNTTYVRAVRGGQ